MAKILVWPGVGSTHRVPVYDPPVRLEDEDEEAFGERRKLYEARRDIIAHVRLLARELARELQSERRRIYAEEQLRAHAAGETDGIFSDEFLAKLIALNRKVVRLTLTRLEGVQIEADPHTIIDLGKDRLSGEQLAELVEGADLLGMVALACDRGQTPTPAQLDSCGS